MSSKHFVISVFIVLALTLAWGQESPAAEPESSPTKAETKELSGMSIVGNDEAPKSLYIVPWKSSELGMETSMNRMLNESDVPIDPEVFMRQLSYFDVSTGETEEILKD
jgi:hypothetical protein